MAARIVAVDDLAQGAIENHERITHLHMKDRKKDLGPSMPWGQGDTPIKEVLTLLKESHYPIPAKDFAETLGAQPSLSIPFEPHLFGSAANNAQMLMQASPKSAVSEGIRLLAEILTGRKAQPDTNKSVLPFMSFMKGRKQA